MNKTLQICINFANFANNHGIKPNDLAELIDLADKSAAAQTVEINSNSKRADNANRRFEEKANALGFEAEWNGVRPHLVKDNRSLFLPTKS